MDAERDRVGRYRIGAVAKATGISTHTLRVWERRYQAFALSRTEGGVRLYSDADVARLRTLKQLLERGHAIGQVAPLPDEELGHLLAEGGLQTPQPAPAAPTGDFESVRQSFLEAVRAFDLAHAERILQGAVAGNDPGRLVLEVLPPLFEEIGRRWAAGEFNVAHEHAASALLRNALGGLLRAPRATTEVGTVVTATLPGELHEFGALLVALLAAAHGWNAVYLGPNLPAEEILLAVSRSHARAVLISMVYLGTRAAARRFGSELERLRAGLPSGVELIGGGAAAPELEAFLGGATVLPDLEALDAWFTRRRHLTRPPGIR